MLVRHACTCGLSLFSLITLDIFFYILVDCFDLEFKRTNHAALLFKFIIDGPNCIITYEQIVTLVIDVWSSFLIVVGLSSWDSIFVSHWCLLIVVILLFSFLVFNFSY